MSTYELLSVLFTGGTLVAAVIVAAIYNGQLKEMQKATEATQLAAKAAEKAANVAEDSQRQSALQFRLDERPYVVMESLVLIGDPTVGQPLTGQVVWKNTGKTPALKARTATVLVIYPTEPTQMKEWLISAKKRRLSS